MGTPPTNRQPALALRLAMAAAFVLTVVGVLFWVARTFLWQADRSIILPPDVLAEARKAVPTPGASPNTGDTGIFPGNSQMTFTGTVVDAQTHALIPSFTVRIGYNYGLGQPIYFNAAAPRHFRGGKFTITPPVWGGAQMVWLARVDAPGHLPSVSEPLSKSAPADLELTRSPDLKGVVFNPNGGPADGAVVQMAVDGVEATVDGDNFKDFNAYGFHTTTTAEGKFAFPPQRGSVALMAMNERGFAEIDGDASDYQGAHPTKKLAIHLLPWGSISGRLMIAGKPGARRRIVASSPDPTSTDQPQVTKVASTQTDADGRFRLARVAPGLMQVSREFKLKNSYYTRNFRTQTELVTVTAGQTAVVNLGGNGRPVVGRLVMGKQTINLSGYYVNQNVYGSTTPDSPPRMPANVRSAGPIARQMWMSMFALTSAGRAYVAAHPMAQPQQRLYSMEFSYDGKFRIEDVVPGDYRIWLYLGSVTQARSPGPAQAPFTMPAVPEGYSSTPLVLPDIQLQQN